MKARRMLAVFLWVLLGVVARAEDSATRPNIILIVADDMGYSDPGCFGGEMETPALDRLAYEGVRFTNLYNCGMCVTTRASLLSGDWWPRALPNFGRARLLSEGLHDAGYRTALIGKWHLPGHPMDREFDHFFGFLDGFSDHFDGSDSYRLDREPFRRFGPDYYSSDAFTDRAIAFIQSSSPDGEKPFMLYLCYQAPHNPLQAPRADVMKHRGKYLKGWQAIRESRFRRQKEMGVVPADSKLPEYPRNLPDWETLSSEQRDLEDLRMSVYAAMIERMDRGIGRVIAALKEAGHVNNTLVLFASDNGTDSFSVVDKPLLARGKLPGDRRSNWQPGTGWAYASVTPWWLYKISQHAGGVMTGAIAWWANGVEQPGRIEPAHMHVVDVLPTLLAAAGVESDPLVAGESFLPLLRGTSWRRSGPLFFQFMDNRAIRTREWTLAEVDGAGWKLYHTSDDPFENGDVRQGHPALAADLENQWLTWWRNQSGEDTYQPKSTRNGPHYRPQGDRGSGARYQPSAMPADLADRYPIP